MNHRKTQTDTEGAITAVALDRRRSLRRHLQSTIPVRLRGIGDEMDWQCEAKLLNLSLSGMACRVVNERIGALCENQTLEAVFRLAGCPAAFHLRTRITNITPAGSPQHVILGLEFVEDDRFLACRSKLHEAVERTGEFPD